MVAIHSGVNLGIPFGNSGPLCLAETFTANSTLPRSQRNCTELATALPPDIEELSRFFDHFC